MDNTDYEKIEWEDYPIKRTPINAHRLNKMDEQIYTNQQNVKELSESVVLRVVDGKLCIEVDE